MHGADLLHQEDTLHQQPEGEHQPHAQHHKLQLVSLLAGDLFHQHRQADMLVALDGVGGGHPQQVQHDIACQLLGPDGGGAKPAQDDLHEDQEHHHGKAHDEERLLEILIDPFQ